MRIVFAGTPEFALPSLRVLLEGPDSVVGVLTQPDRPAGRGRRPQPSAVKRAAMEAGVPIAQPSSLVGPEDRAALAGWSPDLMVVAAYGLILPRAVLDLPPLGCINVHASLLPAYRGAAPVARAILDGCSETGVTIMEMAEGLDSGEILLQRSRSIGDRETAGELQAALAHLGAEALKEVLPGVREGTITADPQDPARASYAPKIRKEEAELDWGRDAACLDRAVRAFNPWPMAFTFREGAHLRVWRARAGEAIAGSPGEVALPGRGPPAVACGDGRSLILEEVQAAGRKRMPGDAAARGGHLAAGDRLGRGGAAGTE